MNKALISVENAFVSGERSERARIRAMLRSEEARQRLAEEIYLQDPIVDPWGDMKMWAQLSYSETVKPLEKATAALSVIEGLIGE